MPADTSARSGPRHALRKAFYQVFYRVPASWRRVVVRALKPRYIIGAVVLVRTPTDQLLLLRQPPGNAWSLPGGLMDRRERPPDCAARELAEETGIRLPAAKLTAANPNAVVHVRGAWVDCVFEARVPADTAVHVDGAEVFEAVFHAVDSLPPLTVPTARLLGHYGIGPYAQYPETRG
jgi:ADP-ribose pyrophosphatase YjhB (NUDIX family)